jgi:dienelactone hydrolase
MSPSGRAGGGLSPGTRSARIVSGVTDEPRWAARFRAPRVFLPAWAADAPDRCLYLSNASGRRELYAWDRATGAHRQLTDRRNGTRYGAIEPSGERIWWFDDTDGDEWGRWLREPFGGGVAEPAVPGLAAGYQAGLALGRKAVAVGTTTGAGIAVRAGGYGGELPVIYAHSRYAEVSGLSRDDELACLVHSEGGDILHPAVRVVRVAGGGTVGELDDGPRLGLVPLGFSPVPGDSRLLLAHERRGRQEPLVWDPVRGTEHELRIDLPGELSASWYPDGAAILLNHAVAGRSELYRYQFDGGELTAVETPRGLVDGATARPDGTVEYAWSSASTPPAVRSSTGSVVLRAPGPIAPSTVDIVDSWVEGPGGAVHALVSCPPAERPFPTVFALHGGPHSLDADAFSPARAALVDAGYCVVHVNYRGSTGYGAAWRDGLIGAPGLTELADVAAVHDWAVRSGLSDPDRCVLSGASWGGYLTLLGLGTQPQRWAVGLAVVPVADYLTAYLDEMDSLKALDRGLFGGTPEEVPEVYRRCSPLTYVDRVRAPVLVLAGENDARCPIRQIENYLARLTARDAPHEVYRFDAGHGSLVVAEQIRQAAAQLDFLRRHLPARRPAADPAT